MIRKLNRFNVVLTVIIFMAITILVSAAPLPERPIVTEAPNGNKIILKAPANAVGSNGTVYDSDDWTVVQWQTVDGVWHDVEGWQSTFFFDVDSNYWYAEWWVGSENLGKKNFRFVVYTNESREQMKHLSGVFDLPQKGDEPLVIHVGP